MQFLILTDFDGIINTNTLAQLVGLANADIDRAEDLAFSELSPLYGRYNIPLELAKAGSARNKEMIRLLVHITAYYLYNKVQDDDIPERIIDNYRAQLGNVEKIAAGKMYTTITPLFNADQSVVSNRIFGGDAPRDNDIF